MRRINRQPNCAWLLLGLLLATLQVWAQAPLDLSQVSTPYPLGQDLFYLEDPDHRIGIDEAIADSGGWVRSRQETPNFGYSQSSYWFKVPLYNGSNEPRRYFLEVAYPVLDRVELYAVHQGQVRRAYRLGDLEPFRSRPIDHRHFVAPLILEPNQTQTLFVRIRTSGTLQLPLVLWDQYKFLEHQGQDQFVQGIYFGFMIIMALYNLFLYLSVQDRSYLYYVVYVVNLVLMQACLLGFAYKFLWPDQPGWHQVSMPFFLALVIGSIALFTQEFLQVARYSRAIDRLLNAVQIASLVCLVGAFLLPYSLIIRVEVLLAVPGCLGCLAAGGVAMAQGDRVARFYMMAWSVLLVGAILLVATRFGWLPTNMITANVFQLGSALEAVMLSLALAVRIKLAREQQLLAERAKLRAEMQAREAQAETLRVQALANQELEDKVRQRTQELQNALGHLSKTTEKLEILSCTDSLTGVYNRRFFNDSFHTLYLDAAQQQFPLAVMMLDIDHFKQINDTHGHLAGDAILTAVAQVIKNVLRPTDFVARYGGEEFIIVLNRTSAEDALRVAERVRQGIEQRRTQHEHQVIPVTASIGVAAAIPDPNAPEHQLIAQADQALYRAKEAGRNQTCLFAAAV